MESKSQNKLYNKANRNIIEYLSIFLLALLTTYHFKADPKYNYILFFIFGFAIYRFQFNRDISRDNENNTDNNLHFNKIYLLISIFILLLLYLFGSLLISIDPGDKVSDTHLLYRSLSIVSGFMFCRLFLNVKSFLKKK